MTVRTTPITTRSFSTISRVGGLRIYGRSQPILFDALDEARITIGRTRQRTIRIDMPSVSRRHCVITRCADGYRITDCQSTSGVWISPLGRYSHYERVDDAILQLGMFIRLGKAKLVTVDVEGRCPMMIARYSEFVSENNLAYNKPTEAAKYIGRSRSTVQRLLDGVLGLIGDGERT